jgi:hypothetical protein
MNNQEVKGQWFTRLRSQSGASAFHGKAGDIKAHGIHE